MTDAMRRYVLVKNLTLNRRASAGAAGAPLHRGRTGREGGAPVGQSGTAIVGALGVD